MLGAHALASEKSNDDQVVNLCCICISILVIYLLRFCKGLLFYNAIIRLVMSYVDIIWSSCDKDLLYIVLKLQKRTARIILYADRLAPCVILFNKLGWIPSL